MFRQNDFAYYFTEEFRNYISLYPVSYISAIFPYLLHVLQLNPLSHFLPTNFVRNSHLSIRAACLTQVLLIYFVTLIIFGAESDTKGSSLCGVVQSTALPICYIQIFSSAPCSNTPAVYIIRTFVVHTRKKKTISY